MASNPGHLYVKRDGEYQGKVTPQGKFVPAYSCTAETQVDLFRLMQDPKAAAVAYGRETGKCSVCSRELTDPDSIAAGIGPICAGKFGW